MKGKMYRLTGTGLFGKKAASRFDAGKIPNSASRDIGTPPRKSRSRSGSPSAQRKTKS